MRVGTFVGSCICVLAVAAHGVSLVDPGDKRNKVFRAQKELRHAESEVHERELAVERERNYANGTNLTLAKLQSSLNRAKKDRQNARKDVADAKKHVSTKKHKK